MYAGDGGRGTDGKWAVSQKAVHLASTCRGRVIQKEGSWRWRGKEASQPLTVGRAEARSEGGSDVETWAACRRFGRVLKGEEVSRVRALWAAREGRAPQRAAVKAYTGGGGGWWSGCAGGSLSGVGLGMGLRAGKEVRSGAVGVGWAGVTGGEEGCPGQGREVGSTGGRESVR